MRCDGVRNDAVRSGKAGKTVKKEGRERPPENDTLYIFIGDEFISLDRHTHMCLLETGA